MKTRFTAMLCLCLLAGMSCKQQQAEAEMEPVMVDTPDYEAFDQKVAVIEALYAAHETENLEAMGTLMSDTLKYSPPAYNGNEWLGKEDLMAALKGYHENFDEIQWEAGIMLPDTSMENGYWSGSVFPEETASNDPNAIRVYGTWTATHTETGKPVGVKFYSILSFNEAGQVAQVSEYFDVNGLAVQIAAE